MNNLLLRSNKAIHKLSCCSRTFLLSYSTTTTTTESPRADNLKTRISRAGHPNASIVTVINQWLDEGKKIKKSQLQNSIKMLRKFRRHYHALQLSEWMSDEGKHPLSVADIAIRLDLISKVRSLDEAEQYFESIPEDKRDYRVYGALLNCYTQSRSMEKAEALMDKIIKLGYAKNTLPYNVMLCLYSQLQKYDKIDELVKKMEDTGVDCDIFTYNIQLNACVAVGDIEKMEKLLSRAENKTHPLVTFDWHSYVSAANGYLKIGQTEKVLAMLKKSEQAVDKRNTRFAYECLMTKYASAGNKDEVNRIWNLYKQLGRFYNSGYLRMISSLVNLGDIDYAESIYEEWESKQTMFDLRIFNLLIMGLCRKGLLEKAEGYVNKLLESRNKPTASTWNHLATAYKVHGQMDKAVEAMKKALPISRKGQELDFHTVAACINNLKAQDSKEEEDEFLSLIKNGNFPIKLVNMTVGKFNEESLGPGEVDGFSERDDDTIDDGETIDGDTDDYVESKRTQQCYSTSSHSTHAPDNLRSRISRAGNPNASIITVLDQWIDEGKPIKQSDLQGHIKMLRRYRRYRHALQMSEWMSDERKHPLSISDIAIRLDLISKVRSLEETEEFFESIPENMKDYRVYGSLLNCYAQRRSLVKAEALMKKMIELGHAKNSLSYNVMLSLYSQLKQYDKIDKLLQEMEKRVIDSDIFTYNIRLNAYVAVGDIEKMEKLLMKAEIDPFITVDWHCYVIASNGYLKAGQTEKALSAMKTTEKLVKFNNRKFAYEVLMTLYASAGNKNEVNRIWSLYKQLGKFFNSGYLNMISSLIKLGDIDGAERIYQEWESNREFNDVRIPNVLIMGFCRNGLLEKAEAYLNKLLEGRNKPNSSTWNHLANGYKVHGQMDKSVEAIKKALLLSETGREINFSTLAACLLHVKAQGDNEDEEEIFNFIKNGNFPSKMYEMAVEVSMGEKLASGGSDDFIDLDDEIIDGDADDYMESK
ncbi:hypothetical protein ACFE04_016300 [Oxalis oulophora]